MDLHFASLEIPIAEFGSDLEIFVPELGVLVGFRSSEDSEVNCFEVSIGSGGAPLGITSAPLGRLSCDRKSFFLRSYVGANRSSVWFTFGFWESCCLLPPF